MAETVAHRIWTVPAGTPAGRCRGCDRVIYFVKTKKSRMPIDCSVEEGRTPTAVSPGEGIPHWATCPNAERFRTKRSTS